MGLLDSNALQDLFGTVFSDLYGSGRLIRVTKVRGTGGVLRNQYQQPVPIKVQIDRCDEAMRRQSGFTDQDVKLLVLQAGVGGEAPTTDDVIEAGGRRWSMFAVGEDPARSYWRGRGVRQSPGPENGWLGEFGHWDDVGLWREDIPWASVDGPYSASLIVDWFPMQMAQSTILALIERAGGDILGMTWQKAAAELRAALGISIQPGDPAANIRHHINMAV